MAFKSGKIDPLYLGLGGQIRSQLAGIITMTLHPQFHGFESPEHQESLLRSQYRAGHIFETKPFYLSNKFLRAGSEARNYIAMSVDVFCTAVHDNISPQRQRLLQIRGSKAVVYHDLDFLVIGMDKFSNSPNIRNFQGGVGRCFQIDCHCIFP